MREALVPPKAVDDFEVSPGGEPSCGECDEVLLVCHCVSLRSTCSDVVTQTRVNVADSTPEARRETREPLESGSRRMTSSGVLWAWNLTPVGFYERRIVCKEAMQLNVDP